MRIFQNVRSTADYVPSIEVNVDTVYIRSDIKRVEEMEFSGWEYNEIQYEKDEYIKLMAEQSNLQDNYLLDVDYRLSLVEMGVEL